MTRIARLVSIAILILCGDAPLCAQSRQNTSPQGVIRITVNLVQVDAVVTDSKGRQITNLRPDDFEIFEDGRRQTITNFSYIPLATPLGGATPAQPAQPGVPYLPPARLRPEQVRRTIVIVVNDLQMSFEDTVYVRQALKKFVDEDVQPGDLVAIVRTSSGIGVLQQFTNDKRLLHSAIERVHYYLGGSWELEESSGVTGDEPDHHEAGKNSQQADEPEDFRRRLTASVALDALDYVLRGLRDLPGRKAVIFVSDGIPLPTFGGTLSLVWQEARELADLANRSSAVLYTVDARGLPTLEIGAEEDLTRVPIRSAPDAIANMLMSRQTKYLASQALMLNLADQTGGLSERNNNDLAGGMRKVMDDLAGYYLIGYKPPAGAFKEGRKGGAYHRIMVKVKGRGLHVRSRMGFYGVPEKETRPAELTPAGQLRAAVVSPFGASGIHVEINPQFLYLGEKGPISRLWLHVVGSDVTLRDEPDGKKSETLEALAIAFGDNGAVAGSLGGTFHASLQSSQLDAFRKDGVNYRLDIPIREPGGYQLRMAVRDPASQKVGSASQFVEIPNLRKGRLALSGIVLNPDTPGDKGPAVRRFQPGDRVGFQLQAYNARHTKGRQAPDLESTIRIFSEGRLVMAQTRTMTGEAAWDSRGLVISGELTFSASFPSGHYALQATVTDKLAPKKVSEASQWADFEVVPPVSVSSAK
jgi:VWFA-related protein